MPSVERRKEIETIVNTIVQDNEINHSLFDITQFLKQQYKFEIGVQKLDNNTTGMLLVDDDEYVPNTNSNRLIVVNRDLHVDDENIYKLKKRFIIAHEFAHFILHKNEHTQFAHRDSDKKETKEEKEADYFARCLLMPETLVSNVLSLYQINDQDLCTKAKFVSKMFSVTLTKAKQRLSELGLA